MAFSAPGSFKRVYVLLSYQRAMSENQPVLVSVGMPQAVNVSRTNYGLVRLASAMSEILGVWLFIGSRKSSWP